MTASRSRRRLHRLSLAACLALGLAATPSGWALPQGALPTAGSVTVRADGATRLEIVQTTARAALDWTSFSIAAGERVRIRQPDAAAVLFNRVTGADPSLILGQLQADGRVFLSNPRGVIFGAGSRVDVGGLVATTLNVDTTQLANGRWQLSGGTAGTGELRVDGEINAPSGTVALVGPRVSIGGNVLAGRLGVAAVGAVQVDVDGDGLIFFNARSEDLATRLDLLGSASALAGSAELRAAARAGFADTVLNLEGTVRARGLALRDGQVVIDGGSAGLTRMAGGASAQADAAGTRGGAITVLGEQIQLAGSARLDASGTAAGGSVLVGGDYQGSPAADVPHARGVDVSAGAVLRADATQQGDGGRVIVWSDERTRFAGAASVRGGANGGDGGLVEVSSRGALTFTGETDRRAPQGRAGMLLLDPATLTIQTDAGTDALAVATLQTNLAAGDVTLLADTTITVNAAISSATTATSATSGSLTLRAGAVGSPSIVVNQAIAINGTGKTLTLDAPTITIADVNLSAAGLVLNGAASWVNAAARSVIAPISGTGSLTKLGAGQLTLSGSNSYAGGTTVSAGTLTVGAAGALPAGKAVTVAGASTLDLAGFSPGVGVLTLTDGSVIDSGATAGALSATQFALSKGTVSAVLAGASATLTKSGSDAVTLSATNTYGGGSTVSAGTLTLGADGALPAGKAVTVSGGATLDIAGRSPSLGVLTLTDGSLIDGGATPGALGATQFALSKGTVSAVLAGASATLTKSGGDEVTLSGTNRYGGLTRVSDGTLKLGAGGALPSGAPVTVDGGGTLDLAGFSPGVGAFTLTDGRVIDSGATAGSLSATQFTLSKGTVSAVLAGASAALTKSGADTVTLNATNTYGGGTELSGGLLSLGADGALPAGKDVTLSGGATLNIGGRNASVGEFRLTDGSVIDSGLTAGSLSATRFALAKGAMSVALVGAEARLIKSSDDTVVLNNANSFGGGTTVSGGTLALGADGALPAGKPVTVSDGATLDISGRSPSIGVLTLTDGQLIDGGVTAGALSATQFALSKGTVSAVLAGASATLTKSGVDTVTLSGSNSYGGGTAVTGGTLTLDANGALPAGKAVTVSDGATLDIAGRSPSIGVLTLTDGSVIDGAATPGALSATQFALSKGTVSAVLAGAGATLTKSGVDTVTLSGGNTYGGVTTVSGGTLALGANGALPAGKAVVVSDGATLDLAGRSPVIGVLTLTDGSVVDSGLTAGALSATQFALSKGTVSAVLAGAGATLTKTGADTVTLSAANTYDGGSSVTGGLLVAARDSSGAGPASGPLGTGAVVVSGGGSVDLAGHAVNNPWQLAGSGADGAGALRNSAVGAASSSGAVTLSADATVGVVDAAGTLALGGTVAGAGRLTKAGAGTLVLGGDAAPAGGTLIAGGTLQIGDGGSAGSLAGDITDNATLRVQRSGALVLAGRVSGSGALVKAGSGTLTLSGANTYAGGTTVSAGTLVAGVGAVAASPGVAASGAFGTGLVTVAGGASADLAGQLVDNDWALGGSGVGGLGALRSSIGSTGGSSGAIQLTADAVVGVESGAALSLSGVIRDADATARALTKSGAGTLTLLAANTYGGGTTLGAGTLRIGHGSTAGSIRGNVLNQGALVFDQSADLGFAGRISGSGSLEQAGSGRLTLTGDASHTGGTTVSAGTLRIGDGGTSGSLSGSVINQGRLVFERSDTTTFTGTLSGASAGVLEQAGSGTLIVTANQGHSGGTVVSGGTLQLGNGGGAGGVSGDISVASGAQLVFRRAGSLSFDGLISGGGGVTQAGTGALTFTADQAYTGATTIAAGSSLKLGVNGSSGSVAGAVVNQGTLTVQRGDTLTLAGAFSGSGVLNIASGNLRLTGARTATGSTAVAAGSTLIVDRSADTDWTGDLSGDGSVEKRGSGTLGLAGNWTPGGGTLISAGILQVGQGGSSGSLGGGAVVDNAALVFRRSGTVTLASDVSGSGRFEQAGPGTLVLAGNVAVGAGNSVSGGTLQVGNGATAGWLDGAVANAGVLAFARSDDIAVSAVISGSGGLRQSGAGTLTLGGRNTYAGGTTVAAGRLVAGGGSEGAAGALVAGPLGTGTVTLGADSAVDLAGHQVDNAWSLGSAATLSNSVGTASSAGSLTLAADSAILVGGAQLNLGGAVAGAGALTVQGPGTLRLSGNSTASGDTTVASGTLQIVGGTDRAGSGALRVASGATLDLRGGARLAVPLSLAGTLLNSAGTATVSGALTLTGNATLQVDGAGLTLAGAVAESGGARALTKAGTGALTLSGPNTASGGLSVLAGNLVAAGGQALGDAGTLQLAAGSSLQLQASEVVGALSGAGTVTLSGFTLGAGADGSSTSFSGLLQGSGGLVKQGAGTFTLTGANSYTGATEVQAGRLVLGAGATAGVLSATSVATGAQITLQSSQVFGSLAGAGQVALGVFSLSAGGNGADTRFDGLMSGSGSFTKAGAGTLTLGGRSSYTGGTSVLAGRVVAAADSSGAAGSLSAGPLGTATVSVAQDAAVDLAGHRVDNAWLLAGSTALGNSSGSASSAGAVTLGAATTLSVGGTQLSLSGAIGGVAPLTVQGPGTLRLSGDSTASGGTTVASGTLQLSGGVNRAGTAAVQVASGATLDLRDGALLSVPVTLAGTLANSAGAGTLTGALSLGGNATLLVAGDGLLLSGALADVGVARTLGKTGAGTLTLSGVNASQGGLTVLAGAVVAAGGQALGDAGTLQLAAGSTLRLQADEAVGALAGAGTVVLDRFTLSAGADGASTSFTGVVQGTGGLAKQGSGTLTLGGANTYTGATQVQAGSLVLGAGGRAGVASAVTLAAGAQLTLQSDQVLGSLSGAGAVALGSFALTTGGDGSSTHFDGLVSGSGSLTKAGAGTLTLTGRSTYAGGTQVNAGTLLAGRDSEGAAGALTAGPFGTGAVNVASGAAVDLAGHQVDNAWTLAGATALGNSLGTAASAGALTLASASTIRVAGAQLNLSGAIDGAGALTVQGPGTLRLSGDSTASGGTTVASGTLQISGGTDRAGSGALQVASGATLDLSDGAQLGVPLSLAGTLLNGAGTAAVSGAVSLTGNATLQVDGGGLTLSGAIADSGGARVLSKTGTGTLTLSGVNASTGGLHVLAGNVVAAGGQALGDAGTLQLAAGSTLRLQASETLGSLAGAGTVALDGFTLATGADGSSTSFSGALQGSGGLTKQGTGSFTLSGVSPYTGATQVQAGTLVLGPAASAGVLSALSVAAGAQLTLQSSQVFGSLEGAGRVALGNFALTAGGNGSSTRFDGSLTGSGSLAKAGAGTLTLAGRSTYSGGTSVLAGQVTAARASEGPAGALTAGPLGTGTVTVASGAAVDLAGQQVDNAWVLAGATALGSSTGSAVSAGALTLAADSGIQVGGTQLSLSGTIGGPGALTLQGPGTLRLSGDNSASGGTTVASGTLQIVGGTDRAGSGPLQVASGATLDLRDGARLSVPMALAGTLANGSGEASASGVLTLVGDASLRVDGGGLGLSGAIAETGGARSLAKSGSGTLTLSGINTASGGLAVLAGTLVAAGGQALGDAGTLQLTAGSTLRLQADEAVGALAGAGTVQLDRFTLSAGADGASTSFAGLLQGSGGGLTKQGGGMLTLAGANSYTGATQVQAGTLVLDAGATAGVLSAVTVAGGAQLRLQSDQVFGSLAGAGQVALGGFALRAGGDGSSTRFDGMLTGSGSLTKTGAGTLTLGGSDARSGATLVDQGTLALAGSGAGAVASAYTVNAAATLVLQADVGIATLAGAGTVDLAPGSLHLGADGGSSGFSGVLQGTGGLVKQGGGSLSLTGANTYSGRTVVQGGVLEVTGDAQLGSAPAALVADQLTLDGGTLRITAPTTLAATRGLTLQGAGGTLQLAAGVAVAVDGPLADGASPGALTVAGGGTLAFTGVADNSNSGGTRVLGSRLSIDRDGQLGAAGAALLLDGGTLQLRSSLRLDAARALLLGAAGGTLDLPAGLALQFAGTIADAAGAHDGLLTVQGGGMLSLEGAGANTYTGATALRGSTLALTRDDQLGTAPLAARADQLLLDGGTLAVGAGAALALDAHRGLALGAGGGTLQVADGATLSLAGTVADAAPGVAGTLGKTGAGTLLLAGAAPNSHSGGTRVLGGTLALSRDDALGAATAALQLDGGTLQVLSGFALDALRPLQLGAAGGQIAVADGQTFGVAGSVSELAGAATLVKTGNGTLAFNGSGDHARLGPTQVLGGTLAITRDGQLGAAPTATTPSQLLIDGATLRLDADLTLAATRGIALGAGGGTVQVADGVAARIDGGFSDASATPATLRKTGAGSLTLAGDNRHGGATELQAGALATAGDERLPDAGALQLAVGTRFTLGGHETIGALADLPGVGAGLPSRLVLDHYVLTVRQAIDTQFSGRIDTGSGQLVKEGSGTLAMAGQGSGNGLFQVNSGVLVSASADLLTPDTTVQVADHATLRLDTPVTVQTLALSGELAGSGRMTVTQGTTIDGGTLRTPVSTATLTSRNSVQLLAPVSVAGTAVVAGGTLTLGSAGLLQAAQLQMSGGATVVTSVAWQLGSGAALALSGGSLLQLADAETAASLTATQGSRVAGSGRLALDGAVTLADAALALPVQAAQFASRGNSELTAALTLSQSAALQGGTLALGAGGSIESPALRLEAGLLRTTDAQALGAGSTALRIDAPATLQLGAPATVATLSLAGTVQAPPMSPVPLAAAPLGERSIAGVRLLAADAGSALDATQSITLDGGQVTAPLATRTLTATGNSTLSAAVQASDQATVAGSLTLAAGGTLATPLLNLGSGTLATTTDAQLLGTPTLRMSAGTTLQLAGSETLGALVDAAPAAPGAAARVLLGERGDNMLRVGGAAADATGVDSFSGVLSGAGTLVKQGAGTWVLSADQGHGDTRIEAGTLQLGDGGTGGTAGRGAIVNDGTLRVLRGDTLALDNTITGSGVLEQAGSGTLVLGARGNAYTGATRVLAGTLATAGDERLPDGSAVQVAAGARLQLRGNETVGALSADGAVELGGSLGTTTGGQRFGGPVTVTSSSPITLSAPGQAIEAMNDGNQWTLMPLSVRAGQLRLSAGQRDTGVWRDLLLGEVQLGTLVSGPAGTAADRQASATGGARALAEGDTGSLIVARRILIGQGSTATGDARLDGLLQMDGGTLTLRAMGAPDYTLLAPLESGRQAVDPLQGRLLQVADDVIAQGAVSRVQTAAGAGLVLQAVGGGSITLGNVDNVFAGGVQALSGASWNSAWQAVALPGDRAVGQSRITLAGQTLVVGGLGLEADLVRLSAGRLATVDGSRIAARLWYNDSGFGIQNSAPGLVLELLPQAFASSLPFGSADAPIVANVGGKSLGDRADGLAAGYVQLLPRKAPSGSTVVFLAGPKAGELGYSFFNDGAGDQSQLPLFYNGVLPATPQLSGSLSAVASVSENARRERFEETVRTENVAIRLRAGVIAEVGPGRPATGGAEGLRVPQSCAAEVGRLDCPPAATPAPAPGAGRAAPSAPGAAGAKP